MRLAAVALLALTFTSLAAAQAKPYQWTPAQAKAAIIAYGDELELVRVTCRGTGRRAAGRFTTFRCAATIEGSATDPATRKMLYAKTRPAGGLCWSTRTVVPSGCLAPGKRAKGSLTEVARAVYQKFGPPAQTFSVTVHGSGFYSWTWVSGDVTRTGAVVFSPRPVVRMLV